MNTFQNLKKPETLWLICILIIAAALRFYHYGSFSYSNDELSALNRLHYNTFAELVQKGFYVDGHPGGIQVFLWQWVRYFGDNEWVVRLPFVLMGILAVWMSYKVARFMFGTAAGLFTAAALTFLQFPLLYSQIARPYGSGMLFCLMLVYFWLRIFFTENGGLNKVKPKMIHLAGFTLSAALCMYNHYFSFLFALIVGFSGFAVARKNNIAFYVGSAFTSALLFVPHIPITLNHLTYKGVGLWLGVPGKSWIFEHLFFIFDESFFLLMLFFVTLLALLYFYRSNKKTRKFRIFLSVWFLLPILIGYFYSVKVNPVLQHSVLIFSFPYFIMLIFSFAGDEFDKIKRWILTIFLVAGIFGTVFVNKYYQKQHFGEFKDIARLTAQWKQQYGDTFITKTININNPLYVEYYLTRFHAKVSFALYDITGTEGLTALANTVRNSRTPYFLFAITKPTPSESEDIIRSVFPNILEMKDYSGFSSIVLYCKKDGKTFEQAYNLTALLEREANLNLDTQIGTPLPEKAHKSGPAEEYSPGIELNMDEYMGKENLVIEAETELFTPDNTGDAALVISIETADGKSIQWEGASTKYSEIPGEWFHLINTLKVDSNVPKGAKMKVYFWNKDKKVVYLKNLECRIYIENR
jgi:hypothetical protein